MAYINQLTGPAASSDNEVIDSYIYNNIVQTLQSKSWSVEKRRANYSITQNLDMVPFPGTSFALIFYAVYPHDYPARRALIIVDDLRGVTISPLDPNFELFRVTGTTDSATTLQAVIDAHVALGSEAGNTEFYSKTGSIAVLSAVPQTDNIIRQFRTKPTTGASLNTTTSDLKEGGYILTSLSGHSSFFIGRPTTIFFFNTIGVYFARTYPLISPYQNSIPGTNCSTMVLLALETKTWRLLASEDACFLTETVVTGSRVFLEVIELDVIPSSGVTEATINHADGESSHSFKRTSFSYGYGRYSVNGADYYNNGASVGNSPKLMSYPTKPGNVETVMWENGAGNISESWVSLSPEAVGKYAGRIPKSIIVSKEYTQGETVEFDNKDYYVYTEAVLSLSGFISTLCLELD